MKKVLSTILIFVILISSLSANVLAHTEKSGVVMTNTRKLYASNSTNYTRSIDDVLQKYVSMAEFIKAVTVAIENCEEKVDVTRFNIPATDVNFNTICDYLFYDNPQFFNLGGISCEVWSYSGNMSNLCFKYYNFSDTATEYSNCMSGINEALDVLLEGIIDNKNLNDEQKALLLHDRLALWNQYGFSDTGTSEESYNMFGALVNRVSVCQGYAMAYMYMLDLVGIENQYCSSDALNHGWNIVYINEKPYHVDVTWDDWDFGRIIGHDNFLRSSNGIYSTGHEATDYDTTPTDTKYDSYFWQEYQAEFQLAGNELYYVDSDDAVIRRYSDKQAVCSVEANWSAGGNSYWSGNFSCLASDGKSLFYSQPKAIYRFDLTTNKSKVIFTPSLEADESIFGFAYEDETLICDIGDTPYETQRQITYAYTYDYDDIQVTYGDANGDGNINARDYALIIQHLNGWGVQIDTVLADANCDGNINTRDYALIIQYLNGWEVTLG